MKVQIDRIQQDIETLNKFNATPEKGITRLTFSEKYQGAIARKNTPGWRILA